MALNLALETPIQESILDSWYRVWFRVTGTGNAFFLWILYRYPWIFWPPPSFISDRVRLASFASASFYEGMCMRSQQKSPLLSRYLSSTPAVLACYPWHDFSSFNCLMSWSLWLVSCFDRHLLPNIQSLSSSVHATLPLLRFLSPCTRVILFSYQDLKYISQSR